MMPFLLAALSGALLILAFPKPDAGWLAFVALAAYLSLYLGVFAMGASWMANVPWPINLLAPSALWVGLEYLRTYALTGFPWILLGYTQYRNSLLLPAASVVGVYGLSFLVVLINIALTQVVGGAPGRLRTIGLAGAVAMVLVWSPGFLSPPSTPAGSE